MKPIEKKEIMTEYPDNRPENRMRVIGITGGVGAGKSDILAFLQEACGAHVVQADLVGHLVMEPGTEAYQEILREFGRGILRADGSIDRGILGEIVFSDSKKRQILNGIIHPAVKQWICLELERVRREESCHLFIIEAALLIEDHYEEICEEFWYIYTDPQVRRERLKAARGYTDEKIDAIFASQQSDTVFRTHCQAVIDNSGSREEARRQIRTLIKERKLSLAAGTDTEKEGQKI